MHLFICLYNYILKCTLATHRVDILNHENDLRSWTWRHYGVVHVSDPKCLLDAYTHIIT